MAKDDPHDPEAMVKWFISCSADASLTARSLWRARDLLEGGLTAGQASHHTVFVAFALKYEIEDGLLDDLERFVQHRLQVRRSRVPQLDAVARSIDALTGHLRDHAAQVLGSRYGEHQQAARALVLLDAAANALQEVIDSSVAVLVSTAGGTGRADG